MKGRETKKRKLLYELASSKYLKFELEIEKKRKQTYSMMKCTTDNGHGSNSKLSGLRTEDNMMKNIFEMEIPQALDMSLICKPEWQALWRCPCSFARPLEVGAFKRSLGQPPYPTRESPPILQATPVLIGTDLNGNVDEVQHPSQEWEDQGVKELKNILRFFSMDLDREGTIVDDLTPSLSLLHVKTHM